MGSFIANDHIKSEKDLKDLLEGYGIDTRLWGKKGYKTINHLLAEVLNSEILLEVEDNNLVRKTAIVLINIYYQLQNPQTKFRLREVMEVFKKEDGSVDTKRIQRQQGRASIGDKIKNFHKAEFSIEKEIYRAIKEELGVTFSRGVQNIKSYQEKYESKSYPGLITEYQSNEVDIYFSGTEYAPEGYISDQKDKIVIFEWVLV